MLIFWAEFIFKSRKETFKFICLILYYLTWSYKDTGKQIIINLRWKEKYLSSMVIKNEKTRNRTSVQFQTELLSMLCSWGVECLLIIPGVLGSILYLETRQSTLHTPVWGKDRVLCICVYTNLETCFHCL